MMPVPRCLVAKVLHRIGGYEPERGVGVAGHRAYFLRDAGLLLNQALINYGIAFLRKRCGFFSLALRVLNFLADVGAVVRIVRCWCCWWWRLFSDAL